MTPTTEELLKRAADLLEEEADAIKESHTLANGEWHLTTAVDIGAKNSYNEMKQVVDDLRELRARLTESAPGVEGRGDVQERGPAPLTFFTQIACNAYAAAATRDDVSHYDAMRVALQAVDDARYKPPASTPPTDALAPQSGKKEEWISVSELPNENGFYLAWQKAPPQSHPLKAVQFRDGEWLSSWDVLFWRIMPPAPSPPSKAEGET